MSQTPTYPFSFIFQAETLSVIDSGFYALPWQDQK
jgi:hypothetical protein